MAAPYSNPSTNVVIFTCFFLLLTIKVNSAETFSFSFTEFTPDHASDLTLQGDARILTNGRLALPYNPLAFRLTTSRVLYATPVPIWDSTTGNVASFVTSFSFVITEFPFRDLADGLIFFLAPLGTEIPNNSTGGNLGILDGSNGFNQFVGVEFDTYINHVDPNYRHIGIDVNSIISLNTVPWNVVPGSLEKVTIVYDSPTKILSVVVTHSNGQISTISQAINLKAVLPEKVNVGFSATTGTGRERHDIYSWSFTSTLNTNSATKNIDIASYA